LSIARLREIGAAEGVNWKDYKNGTMKKSDYLEAFAAHRRAQSKLHVMCCNNNSCVS